MPGRTAVALPKQCGGRTPRLHLVQFLCSSYVFQTSLMCSFLLMTSVLESYPLALFCFVLDSLVFFLPHPPCTSIHLTMFSRSTLLNDDDNRLYCLYLPYHPQTAAMIERMLAIRDSSSETAASTGSWSSPARPASLALLDVDTELGPVKCDVAAAAVRLMSPRMLGPSG